MTSALIVAPGYPYPIDGGNKVSLHGYVVALREAGVDDIQFLGFGNGGLGSDTLPNPVFEKKPPRFRFGSVVRHAIGKSMLMERFYCKEFAERLVSVVGKRKFDVALFQHAYMAQYLECVSDRLGGCLKVASSEVLESRAYREKSRIAGGLRGVLLSREARFLDEAETKSFSGFDRVTFYSEEDLSHYRLCGGGDNGQVINLGLDLDRYEPLGAPRAGALKVAFFGSFGWFANYDALEFLVREVWPVVVEKVPEAELHIAGRDIPEWVGRSEVRGIVLHGRVDSIREFISQVHVVLSPIRIGGGVRLKILESLAWGRPVISTTAGIEGLERELSSLVTIADTPNEYADILDGYARSGGVRDGVLNGCQVVRGKYDAKNLSALFC